jgi:tetratricopeptide (TPR) repeat protein
MGAGKAALQLGDPQAAITFFGRAEEQAPGDGRIKMWLGAALVQLQQAQGALKFFAEATSLGAPEAEVAGHRGLAYDMLGDPRRAQRDYRLALQARPNAEVSRHLALSLAISGEREAALRALEDQLLVRDRAAERTRMFVLALTGDAAGAARAAQASMPRQGAAMTPFLERLPALTPAERALAVHLGHFPSHARNMPVPAPNTYASAAPATTTARAGAPDARQPALGSRTARQSGQRQASSGPPQQVASLERPAETAGRAERSAAGRARVPELVLSTRRSEEAAPQRSAQSRQQPAPQYNPPAQPQVAGAPPAPTERPVQIASTITPPAFQPQQIASVGCIARLAAAADRHLLAAARRPAAADCKRRLYPGRAGPAAAECGGACACLVHRATGRNHRRSAAGAASRPDRIRRAF